MKTFIRLAVIAGSAATVLAAYAEGAIAAANTGNVVKDGYAFGGLRNYPTRQTTFKGRCYAVAADPQIGTPGAGWAFGPDIATAEQRALDACEATAGANRQDKCVVQTERCDEHD